MAVFSKPIQISFEVREDKINDFLKVKETKNLHLALQRAKKHRKNLNNDK